MMNNKNTDVYTCFVCLQESTDPKKCTHCGADIESLDLSGSYMYSPISGSIDINVQGKDIDIVFKTVEQLRFGFHDSFEILNKNGRLVVECNDIAGDRLIACLQTKLSRDISSTLVFKPDK